MIMRQFDIEQPNACNMCGRSPSWRLLHESGCKSDRTRSGPQQLPSTIAAIHNDLTQGFIHTFWYISARRSSLRGQSRTRTEVYESYSYRRNTDNLGPGSKTSGSCHGSQGQRSAGHSSSRTSGGLISRLTRSFGTRALLHPSISP